MDTPTPPANADASTPPPAPKSDSRAWLEDAFVTGFGVVSSGAVAYGSHYASKYWDFAIYTWMANFILPVGALLCGFVAATGYWVGARVFNHRPSRMLLVNIVFVSLSTYFAIHHLAYQDIKVDGIPLSSRMSFTDYMVAVTENMTYKSTKGGGSDERGTDLGKWGWGVAALQVLGFSLGGFGVYGVLAAVPYCERCSRYLARVKQHQVKWKEAEPALVGFQQVAEMAQAGHLQEAIDHHATLGEGKRFNQRVTLTMELRKCPLCEYRRLTFTAQEASGQSVTVLGKLDLPTHEPLTVGAEGRRHET